MRLRPCNYSQPKGKQNKCILYLPVMYMICSSPRQKLGDMLTQKEPCNVCTVLPKTKWGGDPLGLFYFFLMLLIHLFPEL